VLAALGLGWRDLFPPGHRHGRSAKLPDVAAIAGVRLLGAGRDLARVLVALEAVGPAGPYPSAFPVRFAAPRAPGCA
jgi:hypothetical protein